MAIETTIGALVAAEPALKKLAGLRLNAKSRYHVAKLAKLVTEEIRDHFFAPREQVFRELGTQRSATPEELAAGQSAEVLFVPLEKRPELEKAIAEIVAVPSTIPWNPVTLAMLEDHDEFTAEDLLGLGPLLTLDEVPNPAKTQEV